MDEKINQIKTHIIKENYCFSSSSISKNHDYQVAVDHYSAQLLNDNNSEKTNFHVLKIIRKNDVLFEKVCLPNLVYKWISNNNGHYLVFNEYYYGYGSFDLINLKYHKFIPQNLKKEVMFNWLRGYISKDNHYLAIEGLNNNGKSQIKIYDINNPKKLPYKVVAETSAENEYHLALRWENTDEFTFYNYMNVIERLSIKKRRTTAST